MELRPSPSLSVPSLLPLVFASGAAALVYQSLWLRAFGLVFGSATDATAMVLAIFMGGLAIGSACSAGRPTQRPLRAYALVEMGIAATALATLPLLRWLPEVYASVPFLRGLTGTPDILARGALAAIVLLPATVLLGATLPLALEVQARHGRDEHWSLSRLYLANTLGGALGVLLGPLVLLPALGMALSFGAAAFVSLLVGGTAWRWAKQGGDAGARKDEVGVPVTHEATALFAALAAASGAFTFGIEVVWTRSLALVLGSSVYSFASMLLAVLLGIALGTLFYGRVRAWAREPSAAVGPFFMAAGLLSLATVAILGFLPEALLEVMRVVPVRFEAHLLAGLLLSLITLMPVTTLLGITFPLLLHRAGGGFAQTRAGRLYAWNTAGAVAGALATDLVLLGTYGLQGSSLVLSGLLLTAGAAAVLVERGVRRVLVFAVVVAMLGALPFAARRFRPWDPVTMTAGVYEYGLTWKDRPGFSLADLRAERSLVFYEEGREGVVAVAQTGHRRFLSVGGKTDAGSGREDVLTQKFIAHVPLLLHPDPKGVLVVGWGAGATAAAAALHPVERLVCVEIEPATFRAASFFESLSGRVRLDPRFQIAFGDGRNHLLRTRDFYDVIVSEPSNPWITGVANLFTREFYATALARLSVGGVFGQWFHYYRFEPADLMIELRTFAAVFPQVSLWLVPPVVGPNGPLLAADLLLVGSREPQTLQWPRLRDAFAGAVGEDLRTTGAIPDEAALVASWTLGDEAFRRYAHSSPGGDASMNTDDRPRIELLAPRRNVRPPKEIALLAQAQYEAFVATSGREKPPLVRLPADMEAPFDAALGQRYAEVGQPTRALASMERAVARDPSLDQTLERLSHMYIDQRDFKGAERAHLELLRLRPRDIEGWLRLGAVFARQSKWAEARDAFRQAKALDPDAPVDPALLDYVERQAGLGGPVRP
jgi:spermidine synthase